MDTPRDTAQNDHDTGRLPDPDAPVADAVSKEQSRRLMERGLKWLGAGIFLMAVSFGINFFMFQADKSFITAMYILTSLGAVCIMKGLADILGW